MSRTTWFALRRSFSRGEIEFAPNSVYICDTIRYDTSHARTQTHTHSENLRKFVCIVMRAHGSWFTVRSHSKWCNSCSNGEMVRYNLQDASDGPVSQFPKSCHPRVHSAMKEFSSVFFFLHRQHALQSVHWR